MNKKHIILGSLVLPLTGVANEIESEAFFNLDKTRIESIYSKESKSVANIEDENLLKAINAQLGRGEVLNEVTIDDLKSLTTLNANNREITSIKGLENATNLTSLDLSENKIVDVSYLSNLTSLKGLYLYDNQISNISGFENLVNLESLYLGQYTKEGNPVSDLTPIMNLGKIKVLQIGRTGVRDLNILSNLTSLTELRIECNELQSLEGIENLVNLNFLDFHGNQISSLEPIKNLTNLNILYCGRGYNFNGKWYDYGNQISDISSLKNLTNLLTVDLRNNQINDISELKNLNSLNTLHLGNNQVTDISSLRNLTSLSSLFLNKNKIVDISALESLTILKDLRLQDNQISDISPLKNLSNMVHLYLYNNQISDISTLNNLNNLNTLYLYNNKISDISSLKNSTKLKDLRLHNNKFSDISSLKNLNNLTTLYLHDNQVSDISSLKDLIKLTDLRLSDNQISDISSITNLTKLTYLHMANNQIKDISSLKNLNSLIDLYLQDNQISDISPLKNLNNLVNLYLYNNQINDISPLRELTKLKELRLQNNKISDISSINNLSKLTFLNISEQKPIITIEDFKTTNDILSVKIRNPLTGINDNFTVSNISNGGVYENNKFRWNDLPLGSHTNNFNFSQEVTIGSTTTTFDGIATVNFDIKKGEPDYSYSPEFDINSSRMYITLTSDDLGEDVSHIIHRGIRHNLPYRFEYDVENLSNNLIEVHDTLGNIEEYQIRLNDDNISEIEVGVDYLVSKTDLMSSDIKYFRNIINALDESLNKDLLQDKLNGLFPETSLDRESISANVDIYIKCENMLSMSLNTNNISFDNYSGTEPIEKLGAIDITVNSSLPYNINAYLPTEISNSDKSNKMDLSIFNIKEGSENTYKQFLNNTDKIVLKENCAKGNDIKHSIDLKLDSSNAHKVDIYKATIKFEIEQK